MTKIQEIVFVKSLVTKLIAQNSVKPR